MGRKRKSNPLDLPDRVYWHHGAFRYVHRDGTWERLGTDVEAARERGLLYNDPEGRHGSMSYFLDIFVAACDKRVASKDMAQRTADDYRRDVVPLKKYLGKLLPPQVTPKVVQDYIDLGKEMDRAVRANRERACLSACVSWMIRQGHGNIVVNPCMRASGIRRNAESKRERYVEDAEYNAVYNLAPKSVRAMMALVYRTLQRPEDIIGWGAWNIKAKDDGRVIRNKQGKRGATVDIAITPDLDAVLAELRGPVPSISQPFIHRTRGEKGGKKAGEGNTYDGLCSIFRRVQNKVRKEVPALKDMPPWGFYDLKGKGATDMWRSGVPIELIQLLCGHKDKQTTEIYIKARWRETAAPNALQIGA